MRSNCRPMKTLIRTIVLALTLGVAAAGPGLGQSRWDSIDTPGGRCAVWASIPGGSTWEEDRTYTRCALDTPPKWTGTALRLPQPTWGWSAGGSLTVVVDSTGAVDPRLTRPWTATGDTAFHAALQESVLSWTFQPGIREGRPVRSAFRLEIDSDARVDTVPMRLEWDWVESPGPDTLRGSWVRLPPVPPLSAEERDSVHARVIRTLIDMQVIVPRTQVPYCVIAPHLSDRDYEGLSRHMYPPIDVDVLLGASPRARGCATSVDALRLVIPQVHHTEDGRVVVYPRGDGLQWWPPSFSGYSHRAWRARCVVLLGHPTRSRQCRVSPLSPMDPLSLRPSPRPAPRYGTPFQDGAPPEAGGGDSIRLAVVAMTRGSYHMDTIFSSAPAPRALQDAAVLEMGRLCPGNAWRGYRGRNARAGWLVKLDLDLERPDRSDVHLTEPGDGDPAAFSGRGCAEAEKGERGLAAFLLGDLSGQPAFPVTLCVSAPACARRFDLDPTRHVLADRAHLAFRIQDLKPEARTGTVITFRVYADRSLPDVLAFTVMERERRPSSQVLRRVDEGAWEYSVHYSPPLPIDRPIRIYLARLPP